MYDSNFIRNILKEYIDKKIDKFVIYPYGVNGTNAKNVLNNYFDLEPQFIVDNMYAQYHSKIIDIDELRNVYRKDMYIILTVEDFSKNAERLKELSGFIPAENIINLRNMDNGKREEEKAEENLMMGKLIPWLELTQQNKPFRNQKINVVFHIGAAAEHWSSTKPLYDLFCKDNKYNVMVVPLDSPRFEEDKKRIRKDGVQIIKEVEFPEDIEPDIVIASGFGFQEPYTFSTAKIIGRAKIIIGIFDRLIDFDIGGGVTERYYAHFGRNGRIKYCDYYIADTSLYRQLVKDTDERRRSKLVEMGHTKFDKVFLSTREKNYPPGWEKLKGRKVILWAPVHGVYDRKIQWWYTLDLYAGSILKYAMEHKEAGLVVRLQNILIWELIEQGFWSYKELQVLKDFCRESENIVFDEEPSYIAAYSVMDGVITDNRCSVEHTALPTLKPICITYRNDMELGTDTQELKEILYEARSGEDIEKFYEMILHGRDPMRENRKENMGNFIKNFDGKNTQRIKNFIEDRFYEKCTK